MPKPSSATQARSEARRSDTSSRYSARDDASGGGETPSGANASPLFSIARRRDAGPSTVTSWSRSTRARAIPRATDTLPPPSQVTNTTRAMATKGRPRQRYAWRVTKEPQMGPEERLFRSRQSWTVYAFLVLTAVGIVVGVILALTH